MLARISVVNYNGYVVLDQYYKPRFKVLNYITRISGITPQIIKDKPIYNDFEK
jgi:RNA exonuclease 4